MVLRKMSVHYVWAAKFRIIFTLEKSGLISLDSQKHFEILGQFKCIFQSKQENMCFTLRFSRFIK